VQGEAIAVGNAALCFAAGECNTCALCSGEVQQDVRREPGMLGSTRAMRTNSGRGPPQQVACKTQKDVPWKHDSGARGGGARSHHLYAPRPPGLIRPWRAAQGARTRAFCRSLMETRSPWAGRARPSQSLRRACAQTPCTWPLRRVARTADDNVPVPACQIRSACFMHTLQQALQGVRSREDTSLGT